MNPYQTRIGPNLIIDCEDYIIDQRENSQRDINGHMQDGLGKLQGKLPWHPTFSKESPYSTPQNPGGDWIKSYTPEGKANWAYVPSQEMIQAGNTAGLGSYMKRVEPEVKLVAPPPYSNKSLK